MGAGRDKNRNTSKLKIGEPQKQLDELKAIKSKYRLGEEGLSFNAIKELKPTFAFDYLSMQGTELCFNARDLSINDYIGFLDGLKKNSSKTYQELKENRIYRFHRIDFDEHNVSISKREFKRILTEKEELLTDEELPNLYQFDLHYKQKARAAGFLFKGVFYIVWFDKDHRIYPGGK